MNVSHSTVSQTDQSLQQFIEQVEKDLLEHIVASMKDKKISVEEAQSLARDFLTLLPPLDKADLLNKLRSLAGKHPLAVEIYHDFAVAESNSERDKKLDLMAQHIKQGDIEKALEAAKGPSMNSGQGGNNNG